MAKRYARLNWQNTPSVATPINATNLNKMDTGIDELDDAIEDLYGGKIDKSSIANNLVTTAEGLVLDARQGKVLKDGVSELNKNLGKLNNTILTPPSSTDERRITEVSGGYTMLSDKLVYVNVVFKAIVTLDTTPIVMRGFPCPLLPAMLNAASTTPTGGTIQEINQATMYNGALAIKKITTDELYRIHGLYIAI